MDWKSKNTYTKTVRSHLYRGAAALAMLDDAQTRGISAYDDESWRVRDTCEEKLISGALGFEDVCGERADEIPPSDVCALCGKKSSWMTRDHLWPKSRGGRGGNNFVWACAACNSDKRAMDLFVWLECPSALKHPLPLFAIRRYLMNAWTYCEKHGVLDKRPKNAGDLPFKPYAIPSELPLR